MEHNDFQEIIKRYLMGQASSEEEKVIDEWYETLGRQMNATPDERIEELSKHYWTGIEQHIRDSRKPAPLQAVPASRDAGTAPDTRRMWYYVAAASVLVVAFSVLYMINSVPVLKDIAVKTTQMPGPSRQVIAGENSRRKVILPDGSAVTLEPHSTFRLSPVFNASAREVYLDGEGFFEVAPNKTKPFIVYANQVITKVLGTSFTVRCSQTEKLVSVAVRTGKVLVCTTSHNKKTVGVRITLTPNQQVVYDQNKDKISRQIVKAPQPLVPEEEMKRMQFEDAPLAKIFEAIEKIYGVDIVYDKSRFSSCILTTSLSEGDLYNRLAIICSAISAQYTFDENRIVISGHGCNQ